MLRSAAEVDFSRPGTMPEQIFLNRTTLVSPIDKVVLGTVQPNLKPPPRSKPYPQTHPVAHRQQGLGIAPGIIDGMVGVPGLSEVLEV